MEILCLMLYSGTLAFGLAGFLDAELFAHPKWPKYLDSAEYNPYPESEIELHNRAETRLARLK